jgi:hypothetical protein
MDYKAKHHSNRWENSEISFFSRKVAYSCMNRRIDCVPASDAICLTAELAASGSHLLPEGLGTIRLAGAVKKFPGGSSGGEMKIL